MSSETKAFHEYNKQSTWFRFEAERIDNHEGLAYTDDVSTRLGKPVIRRA